MTLFSTYRKICCIAFPQVTWTFNSRLYSVSCGTCSLFGPIVAGYLYERDVWMADLPNRLDHKAVLDPAHKKPQPHLHKDKMSAAMQKRCSPGTHHVKKDTLVSGGYPTQNTELSAVGIFGRRLAARIPHAVCAVGNTSCAIRKIDICAAKWSNAVPAGRSTLTI